MILYFTGTGNSGYAAQALSSETGFEVLNLFEKIKNDDCSPLHSDSPWVVVAPTYAWRIPHIVENWLQKTPLSGNDKIYFVLTCGGEIGNAGKYLRSLCDSKNMRYCGCLEVVMPENYIALFEAPSKDDEKRIIEESETAIVEAADIILSGELFLQHKPTLTGRIYSSIVNKAFYPLIVHSKKFYVTDGCVSCGLCEKVCPLKNITLVNGKPKWEDNCTHCMACINRCPKAAIEYGKHSRGLSRYVCPKYDF